MMLRSRWWVAVCFVLIMVVFTACGQQGEQQPEAETSAEQESETLQVYATFSTPVEEPWVGVVHEAWKRAEEEGRVEYDFQDELGYSGDLERELNRVAENRSPDIISGDAFGNEEAVRRVAREYPEIAFVFGSGLGPAEPNMSVFDNWIHEPAYLCGMLAGGMSESGVIGVVGGYPVPEVNRLINAFKEGIRETNPDARLLVSFINSWFDPAAAKEAAIAQIDAGADVLYAERFGVIEAAKGNDLYAFGNMSDQNDLAPEHVISSPVWDLGPTVDYLIKQIRAGTYTSQDLKDFSMMAKGGAKLAPYHDTADDIPEELKNKVEKKKEQINKGLFRVPIIEDTPKSGPVKSESSS